MKQMLFVPPLGREREFKTIEFSDKIVTWLLAVPISDREYEFARENGSEKLQALFEEKQIDVYDFYRASVR